MDPLIPIGGVVPDFKLPDLEGHEHGLAEARGQILVLIFWSAECPSSIRADALVRSWRTGWRDCKLWMVAANSNESMEQLAEAATGRQPGTVLIDRNQEIADLLGALTTPHCFVIDAHGRLRYRGAIDDTTFAQRQPSRHYLDESIAALLSGEDPDPAETPGYGCAIVRLSERET